MSGDHVLPSCEYEALTSEPPLTLFTASRRKAGVSGVSPSKAEASIEVVGAPSLARI
jgi:hypothetical protein